MLSVLDKNGEEPSSFKKLRQGMTTKQKRVRTIFDETLANRAKRLRPRGAPGSRKESLAMDSISSVGSVSTGSGGGGRLLSIDGGGIKGLVLTQMLMDMEEVFGTPIVHCFDWIGGTSTGGMLALCLASGKSVMECQVR